MKLEKFYQIKQKSPLLNFAFALLFIVSSTHFPCISISTSLSHPQNSGQNIPTGQFASHHLVKGSQSMWPTPAAFSCCPWETSTPLCMWHHKRVQALITGIIIATIGNQLLLAVKCERLSKHTGPNLRHLVALLRHWVPCIFYLPRAHFLPFW